MKTILLILTVFLFADLAFADHIIVQGEVSGQWSADTVFVAGDLTVPDGETLVIQPGTIVRFLGSYHLRVDGSITAVGLPDSKIDFSSADTTGFAIDSIPNGGWRGIRFDHNRLSNDTSRFVHCHFSFGKVVSSEPMTGNGGAFYADSFGKITISHSSFHHNYSTFNGGAIYLDSSDVRIHHCEFMQNRCGLAVAPWGYGGAICSDNSNPDLRWNTFTGNSSTGVGGGLAVRFEDCNLYNCVFSDNNSALGGAFGFLHIPEIEYRINNNLIEGNHALYFGGGVANIVASPVYVNNTIVYNYAGYGGGFYCKDSISPDFYNTVFWGNQAAVGPTGYLFEAYSQADFYYCDVEGGPAQFGGSGGGVAFHGAFAHCMDLDPEFLGSGDFPYQPDPVLSPCIDAGSPDTSGLILPDIDLAEMPRIWGGSIDMGAYEYVYEGIPDVSENINVEVWPNPFEDLLHMEVEGIDGEEVRIEVYDMLGRTIYQSEQIINAGERSFIIRVPGNPDGMLALKLTSRKGNFFSKLFRISDR